MKQKWQYEEKAGAWSYDKLHMLIEERVTSYDMNPQVINLGSSYKKEDDKVNKERVVMYDGWCPTRIS